MSKILEGMVTAYRRKLEPRSDMSGWHHDDAMRAALLYLADNVSDEMVRAAQEAHGAADFYSGERGWMKAAIAAALRQADGGGE